VSPEQLLYRQAAAERIVSRVTPTAAPQVQKRLDGFPVRFRYCRNENKNKTKIKNNTLQGAIIYYFQCVYDDIVG